MIYIGYGSKGPNVLAWQKFLNTYKLDIVHYCPESGEFCMSTEEATRRYQWHEALREKVGAMQMFSVETGRVGPITLAKAGLTFRGDPEPLVSRPTAWEKVLESDPDE